MDWAVIGDGLARNWQLFVVVVLFVTGLGLTLWGLVGAVKSAADTLGGLTGRVTDIAQINRGYQVRLKSMERLNRHNGLLPGHEQDYCRDIERSFESLKQEREQNIKKVLGDDTYPDGNSASAAVDAQISIVLGLVESNKFNAWLLGAGIVVETIASIWAIFLPST